MNEEDKITEQTAVAEDTDATPNEAAVEDSGAAQEDGLDELLKEFDAKRDAPQEREGLTEEPKKPEVPLEVVAVLEKRLNDYEAKQSRRELEGLFDRITTGVQADSLDAEAFLNAKALRDPRINQAYIQRESNPKRWDKVEAELKKEFGKRFGQKVDRQVTESRDAVASAVRNAQTAAPQREITDRDVQTMSKDDFDALSRKLGITPV